MALSDAQSFVRTTLNHAFPRSFKHGHAITLKCSRKTAIRFNCTMTYWYGPNDYYGSVSVFYVKMSGGTVYWSDTYAVHWVNDHCYFHSGHPRRCTIHTARGTY